MDFYGIVKSQNDILELNKTGEKKCCGVVKIGKTVSRKLGNSGAIPAIIFPSHPQITQRILLYGSLDRVSVFNRYYKGDLIKAICSDQSKSF